MKKVVLISTGQPATNPRLVKEADALTAAGYDVTVLYCFIIQWATDFEKELLQKVSWKHQLVGGSPEYNKLLYGLTRLRFKFSRLVNRYVSSRMLSERAEARAYDELLKAAKGIKAHLYIGHNLGALAVAAKAAEHHNAKAGFDFEDYHRGEFETNDYNRSRIERLERKYINKLSYYSTSSPLVTEAVRTDHRGFKGRVITLLNCFPLSERQFIPNTNNVNYLKLFWFSQTIGRNRGLETVIDALRQLNDPRIQLTLVGRCDPDMGDWIRITTGMLKSKVVFAGVVQPSDLIKVAAHHDIGLATEINEPLNRDLCLTNKLFTYMVAGLCIVASDTKAQANLLEEYPGMGKLYQCRNSTCLAETIKTLHDDNNLLLSYKKKVLTLAGDRFNWDMESIRLTALIGKLTVETRHAV